MKMLHYELKVIIEANVDYPDEIADEIERIRGSGKVEITSVKIVDVK